MKDDLIRGLTVVGVSNKVLLNVERLDDSVGQTNPNKDKGLTFAFVPSHRHSPKVSDNHPRGQTAAAAEASSSSCRHKP